MRGRRNSMLALMAFTIIGATPNQAEVTHIRAIVKGMD